MKTALELVVQERKEQIEKHGWTLDHDKGHKNGELLKVAATLCVLNTDAFVVDPDGYGSEDNPWGLEEKLSGDKIHRLKVIAALVIAELEVELDKQ